MLIAPIFIPHEGCPYRCVFCNQREITGAHRQADRDRVEKTLHTYLRSQPTGKLPAIREAAFYGGSFTGLPLDRQEYLLSLVQPWIDSGEILSIRVSTHPLFIDRERVALLKKNRVKTVELGIQSTDPEVLKLSGRDCSLNELHAAVDYIRSNDLRLGLQLMPGLPGDTASAFQKSVDDVIALQPDLVRLYPAIVIKHTPLHEMYLQGEYVPWAMEQTLEALKTAVVKFNRVGIPVIRLGLHPDPSLLQSIVAGPHHPAMRYLVDSRICLEQMISGLSAMAPLPERVVFKVPPRSVSTYTGNKRENIYKLKDLFELEEVRVQAEEGLEAMRLVLVA